MKYDEKVNAWKEAVKGNVRTDADDGDGHWVTTENGNHLFINGEGEPTKGNPHVLAAAKGTTKSSTSSSGPTVKSGTPHAESSKQATSNSTSNHLSKGDYTPKDSRKKTAELKKALKSGGEDALGEALYDLPAGAVLYTPDYTFRKTDDGEWEMSTDGKNYEEGSLPDSYAAHEFASGVSSVTLPSKTPPTAKDFNEEMKRAYKKNDSRWVHHEAKKALLAMPAGGKVYTNEDTFTKTKDGRFTNSYGDTIGMSPMIVQFSPIEDEAPVFYDPE